MIGVKKDLANPPSSFKKKECIAIIEKCLKESKYIKSDWYKTDEIKNHLKKIYHNKCAYCEGLSPAQFPYHVEHYRPKRSPEENQLHPGYYWLAYEWSNLLWSCFWCNNYKDTQFPLENENSRLNVPPLDQLGKLDSVKCNITSQEFVNEQALILNPEIDDLNDHFYFLPNGQIKSNTKRGNTTINICKLDRYDLIIDRKAIVDDFKIDIDLEIKDFKKDEVNLKEFKRSIKKIIARIYKRDLPDKPYSKLSYFMFDKFNQFFINNLDYNDEIKDILRNIYIEFKTEFDLITQVEE